MKSRTACLLSVALIIPLASTQCDQRKAADSNNTIEAKDYTSPTQSIPAVSGETQSDISSDNKNRIRKRSLENSDDSTTHPKRWLYNDSLTGHPTSDLKMLFGEPTNETAEMISFNCGGKIYDFGIKDRKVITLNQRWGKVPLEIASMIKNRFGLGHMKAQLQMEAWIGYWDPIGCSSGELKAALGPPNIETHEKVVYIFDGGFGGNLYEFIFEESKIVKIRKVSLE